jgi:hypothetical protein
MPVKREQLAKAALPMVFTPSRIANLVNPLFSKALFPIDVTPAGMVSAPVNPLHALKASSPMEVMLLGSATEARVVFW